MLNYEHKYNTKLNERDEKLYNDWIKTLPQYQRSTYDYDLRGYAKKYNFPYHESGAHFTDEFKKPNHPTFSSQSIYNGVGTELHLNPNEDKIGPIGGYWMNLGGRDFFFPSKDNIDNARAQLKNEGYLNTPEWFPYYKQLVFEKNRYM